MSLTDMFERMTRERQESKNKKPVPFSLAKLKAEAAMWMAPRTKFEPGSVVTAADMFIPVNHPNRNEIYIVLRNLENPSPMSDDVNKAYSAVLCDVEILRMDDDGDDEPSDKYVDMYDYPKMRSLAGRRSIDGFISEFPSIIITDELRSGDADQDFRNFLNRPFEAIPTDSLASHMDVVGKLMDKDFARIYGEFNKDSLEMYGDLIAEKRPIAAAESSHV